MADDSRVSQTVRERVHGSLPAFGREENGGLRDLASTAGVGGETLRHQVLPGHAEVHRVLDVNLPVCVALGHAAAHCDLNTHTHTGTIRVKATP